MTFFNIYIQGFLVIMIMMSILWLISIIIKNASIVDPFWGLGFVLVSVFYFLSTGNTGPRKIILVLLVALWGFRLSGYLFWRNRNKGEDFRYSQFRKNYGEKRYWWISFFQVYLLQGILMWLVSAPLLGAQFYSQDKSIDVFDIIGIFFWITGIVFEAGGDFQLAAFKANPLNKGKVLDSGLWKYTRHPNYFGDSAVWWGFGFLCIGSGSYLPVLGSVLMTLLIIKVSGVVLLEKNLKEQKPHYSDYIEKTSSFFPWIPKK